jgi:hypothetical protein
VYGALEGVWGPLGCMGPFGVYGALWGVWGPLGYMGPSRVYGALNARNAICDAICGNLFDDTL